MKQQAAQQTIYTDAHLIAQRLLYPPILAEPPKPKLTLRGRRSAGSGQRVAQFNANLEKERQKFEEYKRGLALAQQERAEWGQKQWAAAQNKALGLALATAGLSASERVKALEAYMKNNPLTDEERRAISDLTWVAMRASREQVQTQTAKPGQASGQLGSGQSSDGSSNLDTVTMSALIASGMLPEAAAATVSGDIETARRALASQLGISYQEATARLSREAWEQYVVQGAGENVTAIAQKLGVSEAEAERLITRYSGIAGPMDAWDLSMFVPVGTVIGLTGKIGLRFAPSALKGAAFELPTFLNIVQQLDRQGVKVFWNTAGLIADGAKGAYNPITRTITIGSHTAVGDFFHELVHFGQHRAVEFRPISSLEHALMEADAYLYEIANAKNFGYGAKEVVNLLDNAQWWLTKAMKILSRNRLLP
ncbi:MAG: hypothetical protein QW227_01660 [Candidatus Aenigmatarchaeota archaeon]